MNAPDAAPASRKRQSIQFGPATTALLAAGHCPAATVAARLDVLTQRYLALVGTVPSWTPETWCAAAAATRKIDLTHPAAPYALGGVVRQDRADPKLVYAMDTITPGSAFAVIAVCERFLASGRELSPAAMGAFLEEAGIAFQRA